MAYNSSKGPQQQGDLKFESDPDDTQIDFENDFIALKTNAIQRFIVSGSFITSSIPISCSAGITASSFVGDGGGLTGIAGAAVSAAGPDTYVQYNDAGSFAGSSGFIFDARADNSGILKVTGSVEVTGSLELSGSDQSLLRLHTSDADALKEIVFLKDGVAAAAIQVNNSEHLFIENENTKDIILRTNNQNALRVIGSERRVIVGSVSKTAAAAELDVEGSAVISGSANITTNLVVTGTLQIGTEDPGANCTSKISSDADNSAVMIVRSPSHPVLLAVTGSGQVLVGGFYLGAKLNITGSDTDRLLAAKSNSKNPAFYVSGSGELYNSGSVILNTVEPALMFTSSVNPSANCIVGMNSTDNILIQNNTVNKHIVFKASDAGTVREGLRVDGAVPEVVVNQGSESLVNFRVESDTNTHMLFVTGSSQVGIGVSDPAIGVTLDISGSAMRLRNSSTPASAGAVGVQGEIRWDADYIYICISTDTWKRVAIGTW